MRCSSCGSMLTNDARFCASCGHPVTHIAEQRRIVTVLFADLVGFTTLAEQMDPEQVKRLIDLCSQRLGRDIEAFGGRIDKILGDGLLALFGAPVTHEDDPERAVRCALQMHETLADTLAQSPLGEGLDRLRMRIGINTGEVLVGTLGADYTAMGDVVNTAARLQAIAPPGGVLVGEATREATARAIEYESAGDVQPRGREQTVAAWLAKRPIGPPGARWTRSDVALVGREHELALARAMFRLVEAQHRGALLAIVAENGVGKSRLLDEFITVFNQNGGCHLLRGSCVPYGESNHWWPFVTGLAQGLGIDPAAVAATVRRALTDLFAERWPNIDPAVTSISAETLAHLFGHPSRIEQLDSATARSTIHQSVARILTAIADNQPTLVVIDDLHWASSPVIDLLTYLVGIIGRLPLVVMTAHRPEGELNWPTAIGHAIAVTLHLDPLNEDASTELVRKLLQRGGTGRASADISELDSDQLAAAIFDRSGGNPLFIQEMTALAGSGESVYELPATLRTLIGARLDQLGASQRQLLENAATLGLSGTVRGLERFAEALRHPYSYGELLHLAERGLLEVGGGRWRFRSDSIRDVAYQTMTKAARAKRHADIANSLREMATRNVESVNPDERTYHVAAAAELLLELGQVDGVDRGIIDEAIELLGEATQRGLAHGTLRAALQQASRALALIPSRPDARPRRHQLLLWRADALLELRHYAAALSDIETVLTELEHDPDPATEGEALRMLGAVHHAEGRQDEARLALGKSVELLRRAGLPAPLARALRSRGYIELFNGSLAEAEWFFGEADSLFVALDDQAGRAWIEQHRALAAFLSADYSNAQRRLDRVIEQMEALGDRNGVDWARGLLAFVAFFRRDFATAATLADQVGQAASGRGDDWAEAMMLTLGGHLDLWTGELERAQTRAETARQRFRRMGDPLGIVQAASVAVRAQVARGLFDEASRSGQELHQLAETSPLGTFALVSAATAALHAGDHSAATALAQHAKQRMKVAEIVSIEPTLIEVMANIQAGNLDDATGLLAAIDETGLDADRRALPVALIAALSGADDAGEKSRVAVEIDTVTYFDRILARLIRAAVIHRDDPAASAVLLARAGNDAAAAGDVIAQALVARLTDRFGTDHTARSGDVPRGWLGVIDGLAEIAR